VLVAHGLQNGRSMLKPLAVLLSALKNCDLAEVILTEPTRFEHLCKILLHWLYRKEAFASDVIELVQKLQQFQEHSHVSNDRHFQTLLRQYEMVRNFVPDTSAPANSQSVWASSKYLARLLRRRPTDPHTRTIQSIEDPSTGATAHQDDAERQSLQDRSEGPAQDPTGAQRPPAFQNILERAGGRLQISNWGQRNPPRRRQPRPGNPQDVGHSIDDHLSRRPSVTSAPGRTVSSERSETREAYAALLRVVTDAIRATTEATLRGGADAVRGGTDAFREGADAVRLVAETAVRGGADVVRGGAGAVRFAAETAARGGADAVRGGAGAVRFAAETAARGGADAVRGGAGVVRFAAETAARGGVDAVRGGAGAVRFAAGTAARGSADAVRGVTDRLPGRNREATNEEYRPSNRRRSRAISITTSETNSTTPGIAETTPGGHTVETV